MRWSLCSQKKNKFHCLVQVVEKHQLHHSIKLILLRNVDDYGKKGQVIEVEFSLAYKDLLLPKFAVYHSEENCEKYKDILIPEGEEVFSSPSAQVFYNTFSKRVFDVCMNITNSWTVQPWHIKATLRFVYLKCRADSFYSFISPGNTESGATASTLRYRGERSRVPTWSWRTRSL